MDSLPIKKVTPFGYHYRSKSPGARTRRVHAVLGDQTKTVCRKTVYRGPFNTWIDVPDLEINCQTCLSELPLAISRLRETEGAAGKESSKTAPQTAQPAQPA